MGTMLQGTEATSKVLMAESGAGVCPKPLQRCLPSICHNGMSRHMRTTVRLDDALLEQAKREASRRRATLTALIEQGLRLVLAQSRSARERRRRVVLPVSRATGGVLPGIDLNDSAALLDVMENRR
jgi:hypothetical protein